MLSLLGQAVPALAHPVTCTYADRVGGVSCVGEHTHDEQQADAGQPADPNAPYYEYRYLPMCSGNTIANNDDVMCSGAATYCEATGESGIAFWVYRRYIQPALTTDERVGPWQQDGVDCRGGEEPGVPTTAQVADYIRREFGNLVIISGATRVDPQTRTLVNVDTIFSTNRIEAEDLPPLTLLGHRVVITVTPEEYRWDFGDGTPVLTTTVPGQPMVKDITHVYGSTGNYSASVTISWSGTFTIDDDEPVTIPGRANTTGPATPVEVLAAQSQLVRN